MASRPLTRDVSPQTRACHRVSAAFQWRRSPQTRSRTFPRKLRGGAEISLGAPSKVPQDLSPRFAHSMKQSSAVESSAMLLGLASSTTASLPLNTALVAPRALDAAWTLKLPNEAW